MVPPIDTFCNSIPWYLVQCKTGKEYFAITMLKKIMELPVYLPESQTYVHGELRQIPFFPGYFFIQADLQKISRRVINTSPGILHIVGFDEDPQPVPHAVVKMIAERLEELKERENQAAYEFHLGDIVCMKRGSLQGLEMIFLGPMDSRKRVFVLLELMGRLKEVSVDAALLEKVSSGPKSQQNLAVRQRRSTRGKGRKIKRSDRRLRDADPTLEYTSAH
ncbi:MAG TPA: transcription termination/antitermination NusG family protein [Ktedonobacteraceae bacterium]|nr:transcription termination/antitermination NusG family protein [Ktedonobacteraceae bacterium]